MELVMFYLGWKYDCWNLNLLAMDSIESVTLCICVALHIVVDT